MKATQTEIPSGWFGDRPEFFRRKFRLALAAGIFLFSASLLPAQSDYIPADTARPASGLAVVNKSVFSRGITLYELSNGLSLFIQKTETDLATVRAYVKNTGSVNEGEFLGSGISHLTERVVCGGSTAHRNEEGIRHILERLGGSFKASTEKEFTSYYIDCSAETVPTALDLLTDWLTCAEIDPDTVMREKRVILGELTAAGGDPAYAERDLLVKTLYRVHPYRHPVGGYADLCSHLSRDDVKKFYDEHYTPNNTVLFIAGKVGEEDILSQVTAIYQDIPRGKEFEPALSGEPVQIAPREAGRETDGKLFRLLLAWPTTRLDDSDTCALNVLATLLDGGTSGKLTRKLKEEMRLGFRYDAESLTPSSTPGFFLIRAVTRPEEVEPARTAILDLIRQIAEYGVSDNELAHAKKITETLFLRERETVSAAADACAKNYVATGNPDFDQAYLDAVQKVSPADIARVARVYFRPEKRNTVLISPPGKAPAAVTGTKAQNDPDIAGFQIKDTQQHFLVKRASAFPLVTAQVYALGGSLAEDESTAGTCALLADMLGRGTASRSKTQIEDYFDSIGGQFKFYAGRNTLSGEMTVPKEYFKEAFPLFVEMFLRPALSESEFQKARKNQLENILARESDPTEQLFALFSDSLPANTPYHLRTAGTARTVENIRLDDLRRMHKRLLAPERMIVSVFGDIETEDAAHTVRNLFAELPNSKSGAISFDRDNQFVRQPDEHRRVSAPVGLGIIAWPTVSVSDEKEYAALTVLGAILGGCGSSGGRLLNGIREEELVRKLGVEQISGPAPGYLYVLFETAPEKVSQVFERIEAETERIKGGDLQEDELARAKEGITACRARKLETPAEQAKQASLDDLFGLGFEYEKTFAQRIGNVTRDEVIAAAQKYMTRPAKVSVSNLESR